MKRNNKVFLMAISLILLLTATVLGTLGFLFTNTEPVINTFTPSSVPNEVEEKIDGTVKNDVQIRNTGDIDGYIRAMVVINWVDADGNIYAHAPVVGTDYEITWTMDGWTKGTDGFYYHKSRVTPNGTTGVLFTGCKVTGTPPEGYQLSVEIMGQSIQADGTDENGTSAVTLAWGIQVSSDGTLNVGGGE